MQEIIIKVPDTFTEAQMEFIKLSAMAQIAAEMKAALVVPQEQIDAVDVEIAEVKTAMGIVDVVEEAPVEEVPEEAPVEKIEEAPEEKLI